MSDLIRREEAIDSLTNLTCYGIEEMENLCSASVADSEGWIGGILEAIHELQALPSAEPEMKWIPAEEVLPKDMDRILTTIVRSDGEKRVRSGHYYKGYFMMDNGDTWDGTDKEVIAWMPLPEAWRGE